MKTLYALFLLLLLSACERQEALKPVMNDQYYDKAVGFWDKQNDSAFYYFNKTAASSKDSLQIAKAYYGMGEIASDAGDDFGGQESLLTSLKFLHEQRPEDHRCLASDYNQLGATSFNLRNYDAAIGYYEQADRFTDDPERKAIIQNNIANAYQKKKDYPRALKIYRAALSRLKPDGTEYARVLSNMAKTRWLYQPGYRATSELKRALKIRVQTKDLSGQNASYMHLTDYYEFSHPDSALIYAQDMYRVARQISSVDDQLYALQKLSRLAPAQSAKAFFVSYQRLDDSIQTARNAAKNQFALIRYDTERAKTDNLRLQKDNTDKKYQILQQNILAGVLALLVIIGWLWYRKREQRIALSFSQKVHDEVANGLYRVMKHIENEETPDRESLLNEIETLYERSRNISADGPAKGAGSFDQLSGMLTDLTGPDIRIAVIGNAAGLWAQTSVPVQRELEAVLQELMVNMRKHSGASLVTLSFDLQVDLLEVIFSDNGAGFSKDYRRGNGLKNTGNRIQGIGGTVTFGNKEPHGARIRMVIPFS